MNRVLKLVGLIVVNLLPVLAQSSSGRMGTSDAAKERPDPYTDLKLKRAIESGVLPGPHLDVTGAYLDGPDNQNLQMQELSGPEDARQTVAYWADRGVTSFKAYAHITRAELSAAVKEAHKRGLQITGHLCSITYEEAAEIGIDNLEHGFFVNTRSGSLLGLPADMTTPQEANLYE